MKPILESRTIVRRGEVTFRVKGGYHCGSKDYIHEHTLRARWAFTVVCAPTLDVRGFLFDQTELADWVSREANHEAYDSCERLAEDLGHKFFTHLAREVPTCIVRSLGVDISPDPFLSNISALFVINHPMFGED